MPLEIKIEKKNGSVEGFNPEKIIRAVRLAGDRIGRILSTEQLNEIVEEVKEEIEQTFVNV